MIQFFFFKWKNSSGMEKYFVGAIGGIALFLDWQKSTLKQQSEERNHIMVDF